MYESPQPVLLGVNIDHVATLRQVRSTRYPDPVQAAILAEHAGADGITLHLREDRRHIQDRDVYLLRELLQTRMNLEMAISEDTLRIAEKVQPEHCCLVPERRQELTTEGGLDVAGCLSQVKATCVRLANAGIEVSLFIDPDPRQIEAAVRAQAPTIELHTGAYANAKQGVAQDQALEEIILAAKRAAAAGLKVNAGHGLHYHNVTRVAAVPQLGELNIGHSIIARAVISGIEAAVREMKRLLEEARK
ncbi:MAG: pyridoxine 5'-phosphate synthase [Gammaproteobacteria bacterium]